MKSEYDFSKGRRGPVIPVPRGKTRITIRLDTDVLDWFRSQVEAAGGGNYQTLINSALRNYVREVTSEIAEDVPRYGGDSMIDKSGPTSPGVRTRSAKVKKKASRSSASFRVKRELLSQSADLARKMGVSREELIERGLKAVLAAQGKL